MTCLMLAVLVLFSRAAPEGCVAPLVTPEPVYGMTLDYIAVMLRHGARTPQTAYLPAMQRGYWLCDSDDAHAPRMHGTQSPTSRRIKQVLDPRLVEFLPNCRAGDLLLKGMEQHHELGKMFGDYVFNTTKLFDRLPKADELFLRCTDYDRTLRSAQSFLGGAFPAEAPGEVMTLHRGSTKAEILRPTSTCTDHRTAADADAAERSEWAKESWAKIKHIADYVQVDYSWENLSLVADWVGTHHCCGKTLPSIVTDEDVSVCHSISAGIMYGLHDKNSTVYMSTVMREMLRISNERVIGENTVKFNLLSAHDTTLAPFIGYLSSEEQISRARTPPFRSYISMEIWRGKDGEYFVRWVFNGKVIRLKNFKGETLVSYKVFADQAAKDTAIYCENLP